MKKSVLLMVVVMLFTIVTTGCGSTSTSQEKSTSTVQATSQSTTEEVLKQAEPVTLTLSSAEESYPKELLDKVSKIYTAKNPNVTINVDTFSGMEQVAYYKTKLAAGQLPDIFFINTLDPVFINANAIMELPQEVIDLMPDSKLNTYKGKIYQGVNNKQLFGVFYNKKIFADLSIQEPKTIAELDAASALIKAKNITPFATGFKDLWVGGMFMEMYFNTSATIFNTPDWDIKRLANEVKYDSPEVIKGYQSFSDFNKKGYFGKGMMGTSYQQCTEKFATGKAAMYPMGNWVIGDFAALKPDFEIGWFPFPAFEGTTKAIKGLGTWFVISAETKSPKEAIDFYKWLGSDPEAMAPICERMSLIPDVNNKIDYKADPLLLSIISKTDTMDSVVASGAQVGDNVPPPGFADIQQKIDSEIAAGSDIIKSVQNQDVEYDKLLKLKK